MQEEDWRIDWAEVWDNYSETVHTDALYANFSLHIHQISLRVAGSRKKNLSDSCELFFPPLLCFMPGLGL